VEEVILDEFGKDSMVGVTGLVKRVAALAGGVG
jgi:hypothetical protein